MRTLLVRCLCILLLPAAAAAQEKAAPTPTLQDLAWIAGDWRGSETDMVSQEVWTEPAGDCMVGMWRLVLEGKLKISEHLTLVQEPGGPVMHLRHFDRSGVGWEERNSPVVLRLTHLADGQAVFEDPANAKGPLRIAYTRKPDGTLSVEVSHGDESKSTYVFHRAGKH
jgi:hypothetical protein